MIRRKANGRRRRGTLIVEAALVLSLLMMFLLGIFEYSRFLLTINMLELGVRTGAEYAAAHTDPIVLSGTTYANTNAAVTALVTQYSGGITLGGQSVNMYLSDALGNNLGTWTGAGPGQYVCVQLTGTYSFMTPTLLGLPATKAMTISVVKLSEGN